MYGRDSVVNPEESSRTLIEYKFLCWGTQVLPKPAPGSKGCLKVLLCAA